ncbi:MAG TPA: hypothetical protein VI197_22725 [Polyangiaceae bacterium]
MMPKRWLHPDSEANEIQRTLLRLSPDPEPDPGEQERVWQSLLARIPGATDPDGSASAGTPATSAGGGSRSVRALLANHGLGFAAGVVTTTLAFLLIAPYRSNQAPTPSPRSAPETSVPTPPGKTGAAPAPAPSNTMIETLELERTPTSQPTPPRLSSSAATSEPASVPRAASSLSEEVALLREARSRLAHGDLDGASEVLAASKAKFPNARLAQEREAATIELLRRSGDPAAVARARAFLAKYPRSPHARQVQRALPADAD